MRRAVPVLALALVLPVGCGDGDRDSTSLTVLAASSLTDTFTELAARFEEEHPGVDVRLAFDSSATLAHQALAGAPADVLATADEATMASAGQALADEPEVFATNTMVLVAPRGNPAGITGIGDLDVPAVRYVVCVETAPCGAVAAALLTDHEVAAEPASLEVDVRAVLAKVTADEADAGLVYATDARAAGDGVVTFPVPGSEVSGTSCSIAPLDQAADAELAQEFVDLVLSSTGRGVLGSAGFGAP